MNVARSSLSCLALTLLCGIYPTMRRSAPVTFAAAPAQASTPQETSGEGDVSLFVLDPHLKNGKRAISVLWVPEPLQKYCLGKTEEACATIDYCFRTTNKDAARCQNLGVDTQHFSPYRPDTTPRRLLSITLLYPMTPDHGRGILMHFFESAPPGSLDRLSPHAQIKARVKLTRTSDDDQFQLLEVLSVPSS